MSSTSQNTSQGSYYDADGTGTDATEQHFTGKERDAESGLDYFFARYYSSDLARFMTPDWAAAPTNVPYASFGDPQTLNLYAYVNNNPNTGIDITGHVDAEDSPGSDNNWVAYNESMSALTEAEGGSPFDYTSGDDALASDPAGGQSAPPHPVVPGKTVTVNGNDGCNPSSDVLCALMVQSLINPLLVPLPNSSGYVFSQAQGKGERNWAGKASGSGNEEKVNKKARYDPKTKKWWIKNPQTGKRQDLGSGFQPTKEQLEKAGLAGGGTAAMGIAAWGITQYLEAAGIGLAFAP